MRISRHLAPLLFLAVSAGVPAQTPHPAHVQVFVHDTSGRGLGSVETSIVQGLNDARATGLTDERGRAALTITDVASAQDAFQLVARKIGYVRGERFFRVTADSLSIDVVLRPVPQELAPVVVTAEQDIKRKAYHIDAEAIANSDRVLIDATDILSKLRPDMICGRSCSPMASVAARTRNPARKCPGLVFAQPPRVTCPADNTPVPIETNAWVNGRRIRTIAPSEVAMARQTGLLAGLSPGTMTVLSQIKPEHIAEMTYVDELDSSIGKIGSEGGLFIVLKEGVVYEPGKESYVMADLPAPKAALQRPVAESALPEYRFRLLGVFDETSGDPIEGAYVIDETTGTKARTTATGTVSLVFLPEGTSPIRIVKEGYEDLTLGVEISAAATAPLTLVMQRRPARP